MLLTWTAYAVLLAAAVVLGRGAADGLNDEVLAVAFAFAGGAVLASLADTLMPEGRSSTAGPSTRSRPPRGSSCPSSWRADTVES